MTREEAKKWLNKLYARADITDEYGDMEDMQPYEEAVNMAIQALEQARWIPVSERLPEEGQDVLVTIKHKDGIPVIEKTRLTDYTYWIGLGRDVNVRAWMPLPEPYKGESEG